MADLDVQPKKKSGSLLPWILLGLGVLALIFFLVRGRDDNAADDDAVTTDTTTSSVTTTTNEARDDWNDVDFNAPAVAYDEVTDKNINVRGNDNYGIYGIGE